VGRREAVTENNRRGQVTVRPVGAELLIMHQSERKNWIRSARAPWLESDRNALWTVRRDSSRRSPVNNPRSALDHRAHVTPKH
jgi:hypothetical protein